MNQLLIRLEEAGERGRGEQLEKFRGSEYAGQSTAELEKYIEEEQEEKELLMRDIAELRRERQAMEEANSSMQAQMLR